MTDPLLFTQKFQDYLIIGCDEVGRGCLFGPVVAAAVILNKNNKIIGLNDSKKLTRNKRESLAQQIKEHCLAYAIVEGSVELIDQINILQASLYCMAEAAKQVYQQITKLALTNQLICLVDGNQPLNIDLQCQAIVKGDSLIEEIAAASILAKVYRDNLMVEVAQQESYCNYGLEKHKGYPTKQHLEAIKNYGITSMHRKSFAPIKSLIFQ